MNHNHTHPVVRDGWGRNRMSYVFERHWIDRRNGATYKVNGNSVSIAINRRGKLCWNNLGSLRHNMHAVRELANQYQEKATAALDENLWRRDIIKL